jgi:DNA polymerase-3 subunit epsilon
MAAWWTGRAVGFDIESDSANPEDARIITACAMVIRPGVPPIAHEWLAQPERDIPAEATAVHGITTEYAKAQGAPREDVVTGIVDTLREAGPECPVIIHNAPYDLTVLDRELRRLGLGSIGAGIPGVGGQMCSLRLDGREVAAFWVIDTLVLDKHVDPYRKGPRDADGNKLGGRNTLAVAAPVYGVTLTEEEAHSAAGDVRACVRMAIEIARRSSLPISAVADLYMDRRRPYEIAGRFYDLGALDLAALHEWQIEWAGEQAASFAEYVRANPDKYDFDASDVIGEWPMRGIRETA